MNSSIEISIILPTHNERDNVTVLIYMINKVLRGIKSEIIVVDDGSTDNTESACREVAQCTEIPVRVLTRPQKMGLGNAYKRGIEHTSGKHIVIMDADLSHDPRDILKLYRKMQSEKCSVVIGTRYVKHGGFANWPFTRRVTSCGANICAQIFTGKRITDMTNSYRIYKTDKLKASIKSVRATGFAYQVEILYKINASVEEVPVKFYERGYGTSKLSIHEYIGFVWWGTRILADRVHRRMLETVYKRAE